MSETITGETISGTIGAPGAGSSERVRLDKALAEASGLSRERIKALIGQGRVLVAGALVSSVSAKAPVGADFAVHLPPPVPTEVYPQDISLSVVFEDDDLIVVDKPAGMVVHPGAGTPDGTLLNALLHHCGESLASVGEDGRSGIVHRLDKDTSGLLVAAKSQRAYDGLVRQFAAHSVMRKYLAVCAGHPNPAEGMVDARIGRSDTNRKKMAVLPKNSSRGKRAVTRYTTIRKMKGSALLECRLETGRTHQVRVHLTSIGHPLLGDQIYGRVDRIMRPVLEALGFCRQALHAATLGFVHPGSGQDLQFSSELPKDMRELIDEIGHSNR